MTLQSQTFTINVHFDIYIYIYMYIYIYSKFDGGLKSIHGGEQGGGAQNPVKKYL